MDRNEAREKMEMVLGRPPKPGEVDQLMEDMAADEEVETEEMAQVQAIYPGDDVATVDELMEAVAPPGGGQDVVRPIVRPADEAEAFENPVEAPPIDIEQSAYLYLVGVAGQADEATRFLLDSVMEVFQSEELAQSYEWPLWGHEWDLTIPEHRIQAARWLTTWVGSTLGWSLERYKGFMADHETEEWGDPEEDPEEPA